jgi:hypothetical protein
VPADEVLASHAVDGARNDAYFAPEQPGQVRALTNGRVAGLQEAYRRNTARDYSEKLAARAADFGLDPEAVAKVQNPMLVRVYPSELNKRAGLGRMSNTGGSSRLSPLETATNDAEGIKSLDALDFGENGDINIPANRNFFRAFVQQVVPKAEWPEVMDEGGRLSASGLARVRNAIMVKAFGKSESTLRLIESPDDNMRRITNALVRVAPRVARAKEQAEAGQLFPVDIIDDVLAAAEEIARLRAEGQSISQLLAQMTLVDRPYSDDTVEIIRFLDDSNRAGARLAAFINGYLDELGQYGGRGEDMFGAKAAPDKSAMARKKIKEVLDDEQRLSGGAASNAGAQPAKREGAGTGGRTAEIPAPGAPGGQAGGRSEGKGGGARIGEKSDHGTGAAAQAARGGEKVPDREVKKAPAAAKGLSNGASRKGRAVEGRCGEGKTGAVRCCSRGAVRRAAGPRVARQGALSLPARRRAQGDRHGARHGHGSGSLRKSRSLPRRRRRPTFRRRSAT